MYIKINLIITMIYSESTVLIGGIAHIPIVIIFLKFIEKRFKRSVIEYKNN